MKILNLRDLEHLFFDFSRFYLCPLRIHDFTIEVYIKIGFTNNTIIFIIEFLPHVFTVVFGHWAAVHAYGLNIGNFRLVKVRFELVHGKIKVSFVCCKTFVMVTNFMSQFTYFFYYVFRSSFEELNENNRHHGYFVLIVIVQMLKNFLAINLHHV